MCRDHTSFVANNVKGLYDKRKLAGASCKRFAEPDRRAPRESSRRLAASPQLAVSGTPVGMLSWRSRVRCAVRAPHAAPEPLLVSRPPRLPLPSAVASPAVPEPAAAAATIPANNVAVTGAVTTAFKPKEPKEAIVTEGANRMRLPWKLLLAQSIFAGTCVSIGGMLFCSVGADAANLAAANPGLGRFLSGAIGWPVAIMLVRARNRPRCAPPRGFFSLDPPRPRFVIKPCGCLA